MDITDSLCLHLKLTQHYKSTIVCSIQLLKIQNKRNKTWLNKKRGKWTACCYCGLVTQLCLTLCDPMDGSTPGFPVLHHLQELAQTHVHRVGDAIQPSHPLSPPAPQMNCCPPFNTISQSRLKLYLNSHRTSDYKSVVHGPAVSTSPGNLLKMKMPEVNPDLLNQKLCRWGSSNLYFNKPFRHSLQVEKHCSINLVKYIFINNIWKISKIQRSSWSHWYLVFSSPKSCKFLTVFSIVSPSITFQSALTFASEIVQETNWQTLSHPKWEKVGSLVPGQL